MSPATANDIEAPIATQQATEPTNELFTEPGAVPTAPPLPEPPPVEVQDASTAEPSAVEDAGTASTPPELDGKGEIDFEPVVTSPSSSASDEGSGPGAYMGMSLASQEPNLASDAPMARALPQNCGAQKTPSGIPGMDVSGWQADPATYSKSQVNWSCEWSKGSRFMYAKATEGRAFIDKSRSSHLSGASSVGMLQGAYHFALPDQSTALVQADHFVRNGGTWKADGKSLPPLLDIENNPYGASCYGLQPKEMVDWIKSFSNRVLALTGRLPMIYTNYYWWLECTGNSKDFSNQPLHIAAYTGGSAPWIPGGWSKYSMWQFSDSGPFAGDSNVWNGTLASLIAFTTGPTPKATISRLSGSDRYEVSAAVSKETFPAGTQTVYIASGAIYTDALSGSSAAGHMGGPVLLTATNVLPDVIRAELTRLKPKRITILGGPGTVTNEVMTLLKNYSPSVTRMSGKDRYEVSATVSKSTFPTNTKTVYIASGAIYTDALSGSAAAGHVGGPVLLTAPEVLPDVIGAELRRLKPQTIVILGGPGTVSHGVLTTLKQYAPVVSRFDGQDRYEVSTAVSKATFPAGTKTAYIASGAVYSDALSGSAAAGHLGGPVLLTAPTVLTDVVLAELKRLKPQKIVILGGSGTVSNGVMKTLQGLTF